MKTRRKLLLLGLAAGGSAVFGLPALGQEKYPNKPIKVIVPFPPGGATDISARNLAEAMRVVLGQPLIVENKAGANGMIAAQFTATALPDGYTFMTGSPSEIEIAPLLYKKITYDPAKDLQPITLFYTAPNVLVVGPDSPIKTVADLIALATAKPGVLTCGSSGIGSIQHMNLELFNKLAGVKILHVPYKGVAPQNADIMGGQITMGFSSAIGVIPLIKGGRLRPIAVSSLQRIQALPDVPALAETPSLAGYDLNNWFGLLAPAGLPKPILQTLHGAAIQALNTPGMQKFIQEGGGIPSGGTPEDFAAFIAANAKKFAQIIKETNITVEG